MTGDLAWVVGRGGLLGSHLVRKISSGPDASTLWHELGAAFDWNNRPLVCEQIDRAAAEFVASAVLKASRSWTLYWTAGAGVVGSGPEQLAAETATFDHALQRLAHHLSRVGCNVAGHVFLSSSAGGVYGASPESPANEASPCLPVSDYGREKLRQEEILSTWASRHRVSCLIGRISNLYGPGQNLSKPQGLISHVLKNLILNQPVQVYVPLDTVRDYLHADDCAEAILRGTSRLRSEAAQHRGPLAVLKIFAAEQPRSIASLLGLIAQVTRRRPLIIHASRPLATLQPRSLCFRSSVWRDGSLPFRTSLPAGIHQVYRHVSEMLRMARLMAPRVLDGATINRPAVTNRQVAGSSGPPSSASGPSAA